MTLGQRAGVVLAALAALAGGAEVAAAQTPAVYVALGDSYTSGPLVPNQHGDPIDCGRSDHNYPSVVAEDMKPGTFVDVSCGSATTEHMAAPQTGLPAGGTNPPQFNGLRADATVVSVGIGGNDAGLVGVAEECAQLGATAPTGTACRDHYAPGGKDTVAAKIDAAAPKIAAVLQGIHAHSPQARTLIVGYPDVLPRSGPGCWPEVPLSPDDVRYIDELIIRINRMIADQAALNDAEFVDTYRDSIGHDVCTLPGTRWFEGLVPTEPAFPLHPNVQGEATMGRSVIAALKRARPPGPSGSASRPELSRLRVARRRLRAGRGIGISYRLDRAATVTFTVARARRGGRYSRPFAEVKASGRQGTNRIRIRARVLGRRAGRYRLTATPSADGVSGTARRFRFRLR